MVQQKDKYIAFFWILVGLVICYKSYHLELGKLYRPGPGFMPFIAGGMLGVLGLILLFSTHFQKEGKETKKEDQVSFRFHPLILILLILIAYSIMLNWIGYMISTFFLMLSLFSFGSKKRKWWLIVGGALLVTLISYLVFDVWLKCSFPKGILKDILRI